jgi:hypothetical protein
MEKSVQSDVSSNLTPGGGTSVSTGQKAEMA